MLSENIGDLYAFLCFLICWIGYTWFADHIRRREGNIMVAMHDVRVVWMERMLKREIRIGDVSIVSTLARSGNLFVTTSVFILGGLVAIMGALDKARSLVGEFALVVQASREMWEIKILVLILIFVYAFFKFVWSVRQFNFSLMLLGAAPLHDELDAPDRETFPRRAARVISLAVDSFSRGVRAYYFGLAALGWFVHPWVLGLASIWVVIVLHRREFRSKTLRTLGASDGDPYRALSEDKEKGLAALAERESPHDP